MPAESCCAQPRGQVVPTLLNHDGKGALNRILEGDGLLISGCPSKLGTKVPPMPS